MTATLSRRARLNEVLADHATAVLGVVLVVLVLLTAAVEPSYLSVTGLRNTLLIAAPLGIMAAGQTILMLTGGIDLSVTMIATGAAYVAGNQSPRGAVIAMLLGLLVGVVAGAVNGIGVGVFRVNPLIMTLAMSAILLGLFTQWAQTILQGSTAAAPLIKTLGGGSFADNLIPYAVVIWALLSAGLLLLLHRTGLGRMIYGVGDNEMALRLAGVRPWQIYLTVYVLAGVGAAIAGILLAGRTGAVDLQLASAFLLPSVAAAVIGGTSIFGGVGGYSGTIIGALILSVLNSMLTFLDVGQGLQQIVYGSIVLTLAWAYASLTGPAGGAGGAGWGR
ncbi:MAG: ABC transporter permease [Acidimicrobiia bacterium]|nr:ABC transporter permease [Acidimicrobiia bacterium]